MIIDPTPSFSPITDIREGRKSHATAEAKPAAPPQAEDTAEIRGAKGNKEKKEAKPAPELAPGEAPNVVVLREGGLEALVDTIGEAKKTLDLKIYIITANQKEIMDALHGALDRGVKVRLQVEDDPFYWTPSHDNPSKPAIDELVKAGAKYKPDNPLFSKRSVTHEKSMVIDGKKAIILTGNLGKSAFSTNLDLGAIILKDPKVAGQVQTIFNSDWDRTPLPELEDTGLVVSPENARDQIMELFDSAGKSIHVLQQGFTDRGVLTKLKEKADSGIDVELLLTDPGIAQNNMQAAAFMATNGVSVRYLETPYIHAKAVTIDAQDGGGKDTTSYIGSQNFSMSALDRNRELGYIFKDQTGKVEKIIDEYSPKGYDIPAKQVVTDSGAVGSALGLAARMAEKEIVLETNLFTDTRTLSALTGAAGRGVKVQVIMPSNPFPWDPKYDGNKKTAEALKSKGVDVKWSDDAQKAVKGSVMIVDGKEAILATDNISGSAFSRNVSLSTLNIAPKDVSELSKLVSDDWKAGDPAKTPATSPDLVVSPQNARKKLADLVEGATKSLDVATEKLADKQMVALLKKKAQQGVPVHLVLGDRKFSQWDKETMAELRKAGVEVEVLSYLPLHANYIAADGKEAYVGSHSLDTEVLDTTRAFGAVATDPNVLKIADKKFQEIFFISLLDTCEKTVALEKKQLVFPADRLLLDIVLEKAKYGVKVDMTVGNPEAAGVSAQIDRLNEKLAEVAKLDPEKDKEAIAEFYGLKFKPEVALAAHRKLVEALNNLEKGARLVEIAKKSPDNIAQDYIQLDGRKIALGQHPQNMPEEGGGGDDAKTLAMDFEFDDNAWNLVADLTPEP